MHIAQKNFPRIFTNLKGPSVQEWYGFKHRTVHHFFPISRSQAEQPDISRSWVSVDDTRASCIFYFDNLIFWYKLCRRTNLGNEDGIPARILSEVDTKWEAKLKAINAEASKFKVAQAEKAPTESVDKKLTEEPPSLELEIIEFRKAKIAWDVILPTLAEIAPTLKVLDLLSVCYLSVPCIVLSFDHPCSVSFSHLCDCFHQCLPRVESSLTNYFFSFVVITTWERHLCCLVSLRWQVWRSLTYVKTKYQGISSNVIMKKKLDVLKTEEVFRGN